MQLTLMVVDRASARPSPCTDRRRLSPTGTASSSSVFIVGSYGCAPAASARLRQASSRLWPRWLRRAGSRLWPRQPRRLPRLAAGWRLWAWPAASRRLHHRSRQAGCWLLLRTSSTASGRLPHRSPHQVDTDDTATLLRGHPSMRSCQRSVAFRASCIMGCGGPRAAKWTPTAGSSAAHEGDVHLVTNGMHRARAAVVPMPMHMPPSPRATD